MSRIIKIKIMENQNDQIIKTGDWFLTLFISAIPLVGFIMLFVWAFSGGTNSSKANWAKATLLWIAISIFFVIMLFILFGAVLLRLFSNS
jgi:hypothetical protein